jgi:diadenosine tetraphosphate (Ap4A) HIT family hydrolase
LFIFCFFFFDCSKLKQLIVFGQYNVSPREFFFTSTLSAALVNQKPLVPGHVLVIPHRRTSSFAELSADEVADLWRAAQRIGSVLVKHVGATACTYAIQDGRDAGQTVDHVHVHILPRRPGDFGRNDEIYEQLDRHKVKEFVVDDAKRVARTDEQMFAEADTFRNLFEPHEKLSPFENE